MTGDPSSPGVLDAHLLLREEAFVRRLARALLFDDHRVDDVVQQTWLSALERPPAHAANLRSWLAVVARNVAAKLQRSEINRSRHERRVAAEKAAPRWQDLKEQEALRERLANADAELTAMTLALEDERQKAQETLTLLAAANALEGDLQAQLVAFGFWKPDPRTRNESVSSSRGKISRKRKRGRKRRDIGPTGVSTSSSRAAKNRRRIGFKLQNTAQ